MAGLDDIKRSIHGDLVDAMTSYGASDPQSRVVLEDADLPDEPPAVSFRESTSIDTRGIGGDLRVDEVITNQNGDTVDVRFREDVTALFTVTPMARDDQTVTAVYESVRQQFTAYGRVLDPSTLHDDVQRVRVDGNEPADESERRADLLPIEVDFGRTFLYSDVTGSTLPPATSVEIRLDVDGDDVDEIVRTVD